MRLNGWQRLFVVVAVVYGAAVAIGSWIFAPTPRHRFEHGERAWSPSRIWAAARDRGATIQGANFEVVWAYDTAYPRRWFVDLGKAEQDGIRANVERMTRDKTPDDQIGDYLATIERLQSDSSRPKTDIAGRIPPAVDWKRLSDSLVAGDDRQFRAELVQHVRSALLAWAVPLGVLYLFGVGAAWVRAGFRREVAADVVSPVTPTDT